MNAPLAPQTDVQLEIWKARWSDYMDDRKDSGNDWQNRATLLETALHLVANRPERAVEIHQHLHYESRRLFGAA